MPVSRRSFLGALKPGASAFPLAFVAARGREAFTAAEGVEPSAARRLRHPARQQREPARARGRRPWTR